MKNYTEIAKEWMKETTIPCCKSDNQRVWEGRVLMFAAYLDSKQPVECCGKCLGKEKICLNPLCSCHIMLCHKAQETMFEPCGKVVAHGGTASSCTLPKGHPTGECTAKPQPVDWQDER
jgi:hypothetical protein